MDVLINNNSGMAKPSNYHSFFQPSYTQIDERKTFRNYENQTQVSNEEAPPMASRSKLAKSYHNVFHKMFLKLLCEKKPPHFCQFSKITREPIIAGMQRNKKKIGIISQFRKNFFSLSPFRRSSFFPEFAESIRSGIQRGRAGHGRQ